MRFFSDMLVVTGFVHACGISSVVNKTQIIAPLVAIALAAMVFATIQHRRNYRYFLSFRVSQVGLELVKATNSAALVRMPDGLRTKLSTFLEVPARIYSVFYGDTRRPVGDGSADVCLFLKNQRDELLGIRLQMDQDSSNFHVLGFWTPQPSELNSPVR
jgi:hypothetical protein